MTEHTACHYLAVLPSFFETCVTWKIHFSSSAHVRPKLWPFSRFFEIDAWTIEGRSISRPRLRRPGTSPVPEIADHFGPPRKSVAVGTEIAPRTDPYVEALVPAIDAELLRRFSAKPAFADCLIDEGLRTIIVPFNENGEQVRGFVAARLFRRESWFAYSSTGASPTRTNARQISTYQSASTTNRGGMLGCARTTSCRQGARTAH